MMRPQSPGGLLRGQWGRMGQLGHSRNLSACGECQRPRRFPEKLCNPQGPLRYIHHLAVRADI